MPETTRPTSAWVDELCDRFEAGWKAGNPPTAESLLENCPASGRQVALGELVALEREFRADVGRPLTREEAATRFRRFGLWVEAVLDHAFPPPLTLTVTVTAGPHAGEGFAMAGEGSYTVGRQAGLSVSLPLDDKVSRLHMLFTVANGGVRVVDLGSTGGTYVGGKRVTEWTFSGGGVVKLSSKTVLQLTLLGGDRNGTVTGGPALLRVPQGNGTPDVPGYQVGDELGRGQMGVVYRATHQATGQTVALKTILPALVPTRAMVARFCREADLLARLNHPNVVGFRASGAAGNLLFVAMEFVPGRSGSDVAARDGRLTVERVRVWADQMLAGLSHAHAAGIVHRDVKPANLLVSGAPGAEVIKVSDFGLARAYEASGASGITADGTACGTLAFMPPEQVTDARRVGPPADLYAVAATLYQLLTGQTLYPEERSARSLIPRILTHDPLPLRADAPALPEPFGRVIRRGLARNPHDRHPSADAMRADLRRG